jgi:glycosyltransferase involved in cell wall biosynthesis
MSSASQLTAIIRFKNSASTLPSVLKALRAQTFQTTRILGVDTGSCDGSPEILRDFGADVVKWEHPYHHSKVLNFGMANSDGEYALILSSHTVLVNDTTVASMIGEMEREGTACVSGKWSEEDSWSDAISWAELQKVGLRFCSIYSNSFGMLRRDLWKQCPFDESLATMEDYAWALEQCQRGHLCRRLRFPFSYERSAHSRDFAFAATTFHLAKRYGLPVRWLGPRRTVAAIIGGLIKKISLQPSSVAEHWGRLNGFVASRLTAGRFCPRSDG